MDHRPQTTDHRFPYLFLVIPALVMGCQLLAVDINEEEDPFFKRDDEPEGDYTRGELHARLRTDTYQRGLPKLALSDGEDLCSGLEFNEDAFQCKQHEIKVLKFQFSSAEEEGPRAIRETAFLCEEDMQYWYRWQKVEPPLRKWMGPFPSRLKKKED